MTKFVIGSRRNLSILFSIIAASFLTRALAIWFFRPEFAGWFNHTYYYFVQTRSLIDTGVLPFSDLPLLFFTYAGIARFLGVFGMESGEAVVTASRFLMSSVPALTAVPVYLLVLRVGKVDGMSQWKWLLVAAGAFLPLNFVHMPELLQKNAFGILLLAFLFVAVGNLLEKVSAFRVAVSIGLLALIAVTHFGTLAAALMFGASLLAASIIFEGLRKPTVYLAAAGVAATAVSTVVILVAVPERFGRLVEYAAGSIANSLLGLFILEGSIADKMFYLAGILVPLLVVAGVAFLLRQKSREVPASGRIFLFANLLLIYLFAAPFIDTALIPRFLLFVPLPAIVLSAYVLEFAESKVVRVLPAVLLIGASVFMTFGETMSVVMTNGSNSAIQAELEKLNESGLLSPDDLVVTTYGVNTAVNWFLSTKATLITELQEGDLERYPRVLVLETNTEPMGEGPVDTDDDGELSDIERYSATRRQIELSDEPDVFFESETFTLYELRDLPDNWIFDRDGKWFGYR
ncbi:MAG: hypothetical protein DWQ47_10500 [Acidobacteria bacterium]|nr:MAG: hypothetical protein DWQ32_12915 [Acidobacteriota bacterium]REJ98015.1 MAG: hypothetical protein DWQ38_15715 [Acidobacteriota bacterium]REK16758.1 MAG: hypothetical protein DWQ43_00760 [Acidobacteriota bacterium]REK42669.1 MAG: hypothetical protein DWQ47_10500 [Acidobacteriota bacterium]